MTHNLAESFGTLSQTTNGLKKAGYTLDFNIDEDCITCHQTNTTFSPHEFHIDKVYRFEGDSNPDDESIVYAISSPSFGVKGILVNGYGPSADVATSKLVERLRTSDGSQDTEPVVSERLPEKTDSTLAPVMTEVDFKKSIAQLKGTSPWSAGKPSSMPFYKSDTMRIMLMGMPEGTELKPHAASGVISVQVLEGSLVFVADEQAATVAKGQLIVLPENITHSVQALSECFFLLTVALPKGN
jgi:quercetin dioxygenase-like cupin family protein